MSTVIYPSPIFGPIHSRRLGVSLGINLMPADGKVCTFDCIYCECGFNAVTTTTAVKQDLTISCNKPSERIQAISDMNNSRNIWDFVEEHLAHLPVVCEKGNTIISVAEWNK